MGKIKRDKNRRRWKKGTCRNTEWEERANLNKRNAYLEGGGTNKQANWKEREREREREERKQINKQIK